MKLFDIIYNILQIYLLKMVIVNKNIKIKYLFYINN